MVNFHKQRTIAPEGMVRYGPLSNLRKTALPQMNKCQLIYRIRIFLGVEINFKYFLGVLDIPDIFFGKS